MKRALNGLKRVFKKWEYSTLALIIAFLFYFANVMVSEIQNLKSFYPSLGFFGGLKFVFNLLIGFESTVHMFAFVSLILISILFGIFFSLLIYKVRVVRKFDKSAGSIGGLGILFGFLVPGCAAACGIGVFALIGISGAFLKLLPFEGMEISFIAMILLIFSIFKISGSFEECEACKIELKGGKSNGRK